MSPGARRDESGRWDGPLYGRRGVLVDDGERVQCHVCGRWFHHLGQHVRAAHGFTADEYREEFGLNRGTGLAGPAYRARLRPLAERNFKETSWPTMGQRARAIPPEQRRAAGGRTWRAEAKQDPHNQAVQRELSRRGAKKTRAAIAAGTWRPPEGRNPRAALAAARAGLQERLADPAWKAEWRRRVSEGRGGRTEVTRVCVICGKTFTIAACLARRGEGKVCSQACYRERRGQVLREHHPAKRPGWAAEKRVTGIARWQENDAYRAIAARLRALDDAAFASLPERERQAVRLYYGLAEQDAGPFTHTVIGERLGVSSSRVGQLIAQALRTLGVSAS